MMPKDRRAHLLRQARVAAELPGANRRRAVTGLIHERFRVELEAAFRGDAPDIPCTVEEIILGAYPTTDHYWRAWLHGWLPRDELIDRLAEASAISEIDLQRRCRLLREALAACPLDIDNSAATVGARWLAEHPDSEGLLHPSLLAYLSPPDTVAAPLPSRPPAPEDPPSDPPPPTPAELVARHTSFRALWREVQQRRLIGTPGYTRKKLDLLFKRPQSR
jgi:hypothetical protein